MNTYKKTGRIVGILFLTLMVAYTLGAIVLIDPILSSQDYLTGFSENKTRVIIGMLLELINSIAYIGIAVLVFPILKKFNESMALLYVGFRIIEFAMQIISDMSPLLLITLSQDFVNAGTPEASSFQSLGSLLQAGRFWADQMVFISYGLGALVFYYLMHQLRLIPRFLSIWGMIGAPLVLINVLLDIFGYKMIIGLGAQMGLNEIILGIWLIVKGFKSSALDSG